MGLVPIHPEQPIARRPLPGRWGRTGPPAAPASIIEKTFPIPSRGAAMSFRLDRVNLWAGEVPDQAGGAAGKLAFLAQAGANLEYVFTKRLQDQPGNGILYVSPITGPTQVR